MKIEISIYVDEHVERAIYTECDFLPRAGEIMLINDEEYYVADVIYAQKKSLFGFKHRPVLMVVPAKNLKGDPYEKKIAILTFHGWIRGKE